MLSSFDPCGTTLGDLSHLFPSLLWIINLTSTYLALVWRKWIDMNLNTLYWFPSTPSQIYHHLKTGVWTTSLIFELRKIISNLACCTILSYCFVVLFSFLWELLFPPFILLLMVYGFLVIYIHFKSVEDGLRQFLIIWKSSLVKNMRDSTLLQI